MCIRDRSPFWCVWCGSLTISQETLFLILFYSLVQDVLSVSYTHLDVYKRQVHLIDADRIDMPGEVSYHAVENSKLSKPDVMELLQYPIGVTLETGGRYLSLIHI